MTVGLACVFYLEEFVIGSTLNFIWYGYGGVE